MPALGWGKGSDDGAGRSAVTRASLATLKLEAWARVLVSLTWMAMVSRCRRGRVGARPGSGRILEAAQGGQALASSAAGEGVNEGGVFRAAEGHGQGAGPHAEGLAAHPDAGGGKGPVARVMSGRRAHGRVRAGGDARGLGGNLSAGIR